VKEGDPLIRFDSSSAQQQLMQKEAALKQAEASLMQATAQAQITAEQDNSELKQAKTVADYRTTAGKMFGPMLDTFLRLYPVATDTDVPRAAADAAREAGHFASMMFWAKSQREKGKAAVYLTDFARPHPYAPGANGAAGAYHGSEVPYWFQNLDGLNRVRVTRNWTAWDTEMSTKMADALAAFAKTGNPSTPALRWPEWTMASPKYVEFASAITVRDAPRERIEFMWAQSSTPHHNKPFPNFN
jgi:para-nitrobenzyl esterase